MMNHPMHNKFLGITQTIALGSFLLAQSVLPNPAPAALASEICQQDEDRGATVGWTCINSGVSTLFWAPCSSGSLTLTLKNPSQANISLVVFSRDATRRLTVEGTTQNDILVGSPGTSETLRGGSGNNTYVVGGSNTYLLGNGDRMFSVGTSGESDSARLSSSSPDFIHINTNAQAQPGSLLTAASPNTPVPIRGSGELSPPPVCPVSLKPSTLLGMEQAQLAQTLSDKPCWPCLPTKDQADFLSQGSLFPGVTTLEGFDLAKRKGDRILLPAQDYLFKEQSLEGQAVIPIVVIDRIRVRKGKVVSPDTLQRFREEAKGLSEVPADVAPLVYFRQYGLLVFSQGNAPLGSRDNPGRVIARLLDESGRPLKLPGTNGQLFPARFLSFVGWEQPQNDIR